MLETGRKIWATLLPRIFSRSYAWTFPSVNHNLIGKRETKEVFWKEAVLLPVTASCYADDPTRKAAAPTAPRLCNYARNLPQVQEKRQRTRPARPAAPQGEALPPPPQLTVPDPLLHARANQAGAAPMSEPAAGRKKQLRAARHISAHVTNAQPRLHAQRDVGPRDR